MLYLCLNGVQNVVVARAIQYLDVGLIACGAVLSAIEKIVDGEVGRACVHVDHAQVDAHSLGQGDQMHLFGLATHVEDLFIPNRVWCLVFLKLSYLVLGETVSRMAIGQERLVKLFVGNDLCSRDKSKERDDAIQEYRLTSKKGGNNKK